MKSIRVGAVLSLAVIVSIFVGIGHTNAQNGSQNGSVLPAVPGVLYANITGVGAVSAAAGKHGFVPLNTVKYGAESLIKEIVKDPTKPKTDILETNDIMRVSIYKKTTTGNEHQFRVLMATPRTTRSPVSGWIEDAAPDKAPVYFLDTHGWLYAWPTWPVIRNRWVSAAAQGSEIAIEEIDDNKARVYLIQHPPGKPMVVTCYPPAGGDPKVYTGLTPNRFVEVESDCTPWPPTPKLTNDDPDAKAFKMHVDDILSHARD